MKGERYRDRIRIERLAEGPDGQGGHIVTPTPFATAWARVTPRDNREEQNLGGQVTGRIRYTIECADNTGRLAAIDNKSYRVKWLTKILSISAAVINNDRRDTITLECDEVAA